MAMTIWGRHASGGKYAAIAGLTNIVAMIAAVAFYEVFFTDSSRGGFLYSIYSFSSQRINEYSCVHSDSVTPGST